MTTPSAGQIFFSINNNGNLIGNALSSGQIEINRRYSEMMSDRIYERGDTNGSQNQKDDETFPEDEYDMSPSGD